MKNPTISGEDIHAEAAWEIYKGNPNNIIAIIDGGVEITHADLNDKIAGGDTGYGSNGFGDHGSHVAGIAAAETNSVEGIAGVDWYALLLSHRTLIFHLTGRYITKSRKHFHSFQVQQGNSEYFQMNQCSAFM